MGPGDALKAALDFRFGTMTGVDDSNRQGFCDDVAVTIGGGGTGQVIFGQSGTTIISNTANLVEVFFLTPESGNNYFPLFSVGALAGTPTFTTPYWVAEELFAEGFTIHLPSAPGLGNTILIAWVIFYLTV